MDLKNKWERKFPRHVSESLPWDVLSQLTIGLSDDTKLPLERLADVIRHRDVSGLFAIASSFDVTAYTSPDLCLQDRLVVDLFSKFDFPNSPFNKREKAKLRFAEAEVLCREANARIKLDQGTADHEINRVIHAATRLIEATLGSFDLSEMLRFSRFGPGATLCVGGPFTTEYFKLCEKQPTVSDDAFPYAEAMLNFDHKWRGYLLGINPLDICGDFLPSDGLGVELRTVSHNKVTFVPKNAKTERSIAIEPYFNIYFQLGVGAMIRKRLYKRAGINLDSQTRNQMLALRGSVDGNLATIDFSMASDTISQECVRLLMPPSWFEHLERLRSKTYCMDGGKPLKYEKFSTMGNGYTFELETLIFWALAHASSVDQGIATADISVYGDDVILETGSCDLFIKVCSYLGFRINEEKSFRSGQFRESCGKDYLKGVSVRPVFCKELWTVQHVVSLANRLFELNRSVGHGSRINDMLDRTVALLLARIPSDVAELIVGPPSENVDGYIHTTDPARLAASDLVRWNRRLYAWEHPVMTFVAKSFTRSNPGMALYLNRSLASQPKAIPHLEGALVYGLSALSRRRVHPFVKSDGCTYYRRFEHRLSEFYNERAPIEITGRKVGRLTLGRNIFWDLPS